LRQATAAEEVRLDAAKISAVRPSGIVNRPLRPPFAGAGRDLPLPNPFKGAILG